MSLAPELTALDRRILEAVRRPRRAVDVAHERVFSGRDEWAGLAGVDGGVLEETVAILRGLEHLGYVRRTANGWWQAT